MAADGAVLLQGARRRSPPSPALKPCHPLPWPQALVRWQRDPASLRGARLRLQGTSAACVDCTGGYGGGGVKVDGLDVYSFGLVCGEHDDSVVRTVQHGPYGQVGLVFFGGSVPVPRVGWSPRVAARRLSADAFPPPPVFPPLVHLAGGPPGDPDVLR
jgi:hypothetical protein